MNTQNTCPSESTVKLSSIEVAFEKAQIEAVQLEKNIQELGNRLKDVLGPGFDVTPIGQPLSKDGDNAKQKCNIAYNFDSISSIIERAHNQLNKIVSNLEL